ncbi:neprilysin-1-like [Amblyomma americanum]
MAPKSGIAEHSIALFRSWMNSLGLPWPSTRSQYKTPPHPFSVLLDLALSWNINVLFKVRVHAPDTSGQLSWAALSQGDLGAPWQEYREERIQQNQYEDYVNEHRRLLDASSSDDAYNITELLSTELRLLVVLWAGAPGSQSWFPLRELDKMTPSLRDLGLWEDVLNRHLRGLVRLTSDDTVVVHSRHLLAEIEQLLADYAERAETLLDAIAWVLVQTFLWAVADAPLIVFGTNQRTLEGKRTACLQFVDSRLGLLSAAKHLTARYTVEVRGRVEHVFSKLTDVAKASISSLSWAHSDAKDEAIRKLDAMKRDVFPTEDFFEANGLRLLYEAFAPHSNNHSFIERFLQASRTLQGFVASAAYEDVYRRRLAERSSGLASYVYYTNVVHVSLDALEAPAFSADGTLAMNFGGVGSYVAREMCRSFDPIGSALDSKGENRLWWGPEQSPEYQQRLSCPIHVPSERKLSVVTTRNDSEDASLRGDHRPKQVRLAATATGVFPHIPAIETAFSAYRQASQGNQTTKRLLPYMEESTADQIFFLTYCYVLCAPKESGDEAAQACNLPLMHFAPFAEVFHCPVGSPMNPAEKCTFFEQSTEHSTGVDARRALG